MKQTAIQLLRDLRSALLRCAPGSEDGRRAMAGLRRAGLSVYLVVEGGDESESEAIPLLLSAEPDAQARPGFRIGQEDLAILRSLGIDPTRTLRRRR